MSDLPTTIAAAREALIEGRRELAAAAEELARLRVDNGELEAQRDAFGQKAAQLEERLRRCDLRLPNGLPCLSVDHIDHRIGVIVPEGFRLVAMTPHSGQALLAEPRTLAGRDYSSAWVLRTEAREPPPTVEGLPPTPADVAGRFKP